MYYILDFKMLENGYFPERMEVLENGKPFDQSVLSSLTEGVSLKERNLEITYPKWRGNLSNVLTGVFNFTTVSNIILDKILPFCSNDIEIIPVKVERKTDLSYYFINLLNKVDAIDYKKSDLTEMAPGMKVYAQVDSLVINSVNIDKLNIFRLENLSHWIFISEELKQALEELNLIELVFRPVNQFKWSLVGGIEGDNWWE